MRFLFKLALLAVLVLGSWYAASPWYAMWRIVSAAEDGNGEELRALIDFDRVRAGMKADLSASREDGDRDLLDRIGDGLVTTLGGAAIDTLVTPGGMAVLLDVSPAVPGQDLSWSVAYDSLNQVRGVSTYEDGSAGPQLVFERQGLGWQVVGIRL